MESGFTSFYLGHPITWNDETRTWHYDDTGENTDTAPKRACVKCRKTPALNGHDPCIANLTGVTNACCGHGVERGYIQFDDGRVFRFGNLKQDLDY